MKLIKEYSPNAKSELYYNSFNSGVCGFSIEFDDLIVRDIKQFSDLIKNCQTFEAYPLTNGKMRISVTITDVMRPFSTGK